MSVAVRDAKVINVEEGTLGGDTYHVLMPGKIEPKPLCFRKIHNSNERCTLPAGYRTDHVGQGACSRHGGTTKRLTITNGVTAVKTRMRLADKIDNYLHMSRDELLDLTQHLAATRAIFDEFMDEFPNPNDNNYGTWFARFNTLITTLSTLVDKISRIDSRNTLTAAQVLYLRATMVDILMKYIGNPDDRERAIREIASRLGGDVSVEMLPSEVSMNTPVEV